MRWELLASAGIDVSLLFGDQTTAESAVGRIHSTGLAVEDNDATPPGLPPQGRIRPEVDPDQR